MKFTIKPTLFIKKQLQELHEKTRKSLVSKIEFLKENPFNNKSLICYKSLFRIRFIDINSEKRLIYSLRRDEVRLLFILDRKKNYKDLDTYLNKIREDLNK
ncbi:MAG: hypothetical protein LAT82_02765 [Nanoarchaeota archaeon]|nr:hypothetical protein [Nanoarchaeota archaeon]